MWHSHEYEMKSGVLFLPGVPGPVERKDLEKVAKTYGKTIHFWQVDRGDELPLGLPQVMMALTRDRQLYLSLAIVSFIPTIWVFVIWFLNRFNQKLFKTEANYIFGFVVWFSVSKV
ncbi:putative Oil body-associated protein [Helianthus annuus]|nr:putative Oil body-associated protein [Helianthus annuus]